MALLHEGFCSVILLVEVSWLLRPNNPRCERYAQNIQSPIHLYREHKIDGSCSAVEGSKVHEFKEHGGSSLKAAPESLVIRKTLRMHPQITLEVSETFLASLLTFVNAMCQLSLLLTHSFTVLP
ncbi:hypothetical protein TNCV_3993031 [Trichonephila clavipes]|uniref:Uncharacterized protein n=1 Tax=Trichonephila clavipes TaxID=2585209 RepID=A0A8X6VP93_TRICX|nr:hypothetical protein TNCV_3993031 [Trichonephila clavipes]